MESVYEQVDVLDFVHVNAREEFAFLGSTVIGYDFLGLSLDMVLVNMHVIVIEFEVVAVNVNKCVTIDMGNLVIMMKSMGPTFYIFLHAPELFEVFACIKVNELLVNAFLVHESVFLHGMHEIIVNILMRIFVHGYDQVDGFGSMLKHFVEGVFV